MAASLSLARAQAADCAIPSGDGSAPVIVYQTPVVYEAPVIYEGPVIYSTAIYVTTADALRGCANSGYSCPPRSTVMYIGGGQTSYSYSPACDGGSTVTYIGGSFHR